MTGPTDNIVKAGVTAWTDWQKTEDDQLERVFQIGHALLVGRYKIMQEFGLERPTGATYSKNLSKWMEANGFEDMDRRLRKDFQYCAENEEGIRGYVTSFLMTRKSTSYSPAALRQGFIRHGTNVPKRKYCNSMAKPSNAAKAVRTRTDRMEPKDKSAMIGELAVLLRDLVAEVLPGAGKYTDEILECLHMIEDELNP